MKKVQVNTPLILEKNGEMVRIETGQVIDLTDEVYAQVSAHTTLLDNDIVEPQPVPEIQDEPTLNEVVPQADDAVSSDAVSDETVAAEVSANSEAAEPKKSTRKKA